MTLNLHRPDIVAATALNEHSNPPPGTVARLRLPRYGGQEVWEAASEDVGGWYSTSPQNPKRLTWRELFRRAEDLEAEIVLLVAAPPEAYRLGWLEGREDLARELATWASAAVIEAGSYRDEAL